VKIYLLSLADGRWVFYSEGLETVAESESAVARRGLRGWAERKYKSLQVILNESEKGVGLRMRRTWEWLQKRTAPDEPALRALRSVRAIELYYPPTLTEEETRSLWTDYLKSRQGRHTFWFGVNAFISPLTVLLAPLPGPNLIGYWFVYRAVCHWLARLGARQSRSEQATTAFLSTAALASSFGVTDDERIAGLASEFGLSGLDAYLKRMRAGRGNQRRKTPLAVS